GAARCGRTSRGLPRGYFLRHDACGAGVDSNENTYLRPLLLSRTGENPLRPSRWRLGFEVSSAYRNDAKRAVSIPGLKLRLSPCFQSLYLIAKLALSNGLCERWKSNSARARPTAPRASQGARRRPAPRYPYRE